MDPRSQFIPTVFFVSNINLHRASISVLSPDEECKLYHSGLIVCSSNYFYYYYYSVHSGSE